MDLADTMDFIPTQDRADISSFIDTYGTMLYRFCRKLTYSKEDAEDLFQETWYRVLQKPKKLRLAEHPQSYLCAAALYLWKSQQRKFARRKRLAPETPLDFALDSGQNLEGDLLRQAERRLVQDLVDQLPDKFRIPLLLYYNMEMDIAEMANILDLPPGTVKSRLYYARQEIKKGLLKHEYVE